MLIQSVFQHITKRLSFFFDYFAISSIAQPGAKNFITISSSDTTALPLFILSPAQTMLLCYTHVRLYLTLLYHKSSRCKPTQRYAVFCRQTKDLMVKCSQTSGAPQAVLLHGKIRFGGFYKSEVIILYLKPNINSFRYNNTAMPHLSASLNFSLCIFTNSDITKGLLWQPSEC